MPFPTVDCAYHRQTQLVLPQILHHYITSFNPAAASSLSQRYQQLPYFAHALEVLLHNVLDEEVDTPPLPEDALLPSVLSFLSSFPEFLDIIVQCTRKTEVRSWRTLFTHLPPPLELYEASLEKGLLKTAGGYLLVLHNFNDLESSSKQCVRLLKRAKEAGDWELCKELARFLMALDASGDTLREALARIEITPRASRTGSSESTTLKTPRPKQGHGWEQYNLNGTANVSFSPDKLRDSPDNRSPGILGTTPEEEAEADEVDYFSPHSSITSE